MAGSHNVGDCLDPDAVHPDNELLLFVEPRKSLIAIQVLFVPCADLPDADPDLPTLCRFDVGDSESIVTAECQLVALQRVSADPDGIPATDKHLLHVEVAPIGDIVFHVRSFLPS